MKEQLISFETAKLAKEKGCMIKSNRSYNLLGNLESHRTINFYAPTQSLLQKWLREEHNIRLIESIPLPKQLESKIPQRKNKISFCLYNKEWNPAMVECELKDTYEEALEVGLQEALKLI